ncbi:MAG: hypothetical protein JWN86_3029 [Planctomycetota bacterium]|nr:hypothetical protein [Planctomycetota bacterium]
MPARQRCWSCPRQAVFPDTKDATVLPHVLNLTDFTGATITTELTDLNGNFSPGFNGTIDTLFVVPVPEPASWAVFTLIGAIGLVRMAYRKGKPTGDGGSFGPDESAKTA